MRRNKYNNHKTTFDGITFDSKKECEYYKILLAKKQDGEIIGFDIQPNFELQESFIGQDGKKIRSIRYIADFVVYRDGETEIIDVKGVQTDVFRIKWKMLQKLYRSQPGYKFTIV